MMMKRLTAWLLVLCMTLSLLPGTAFAASGGGDDGKVTITYNLNDGRTDYELQLKTDPGKEPDNEPGAVWAGRPFDGWTSDPEGQISADYSKDTTLYAQWLSGYTVYLNFGDAASQIKIPGFSPETVSTHTGEYKFNTEKSGKLDADTAAEIQAAIATVESLGSYAFDGWYMERQEDTTGTGTSPSYIYRKPFGDITGIIPSNGITLYAKWIPMYKLSFKYNNPPQNVEYDAETTQGGILKEPEKMPAPEYENERYTFDAWYILETDRADNALPNAESITKGNLAQKNLRGVKITSAQLATYSFEDIAKYVTENNTQAIKLEANWTAPYGIAFDANGGRFTNGDATTIVKTDGNGKLTSLPATEPEREGYEFIGWFYGVNREEVNNGDVKDLTEVMVNDSFPAGPDGKFDESKATVYAKWEEKIKITIAYGNGNIDDVSLYVIPTRVDPTDPSKLFYAFDDKEIEQYFKNITVPGYTIPEKVTVTPMPDSTDPSLSPTPPAGTSITINQIKTLMFVRGSDYVISATLVPGYAITLDPNGGELANGSQQMTDTSGYIEKSALDNIKPTFPDNAKKFLGWSSSKDSYVPLTTVSVSEPDGTTKVYYVFTGKTTIYAAWGAPYKIKYDPNDGITTTIGEKETDDNGKYDLPADPTYPGGTMAFAGWNTEKDGAGTTITSSSIATGPVTLYAQWKGHEITFDANGGTLMGDLATNAKVVADKTGKITTTITNPYHQSGTFDGWYTAAIDGTKIDLSTHVFQNSMTLYAHWTASTPTPPAPINAPAAAAKPAAANGIHTPMPAAIGDPGEYQIEFDLNFPTGTSDGTPTTIGPITTAKDGKLPNLPAETPTVTGYQFKGWYITPDGEGAVTTSTVFLDIATVYAYWEPIIKFNANGGFLSNGLATASVVTTEKKIPAASWPTATRRGYTFSGWYDAATGGTLIATGSSPSKIFNEPDELFARWVLNEYTITFDLNFENAPTIPTQQTQGGTLVDLPDYERPGYTFEGWYTDKTGGEKIDGYTFDKDTTVYAHWARIITITFDYNNRTNKTITRKVIGGILPQTDFPDTSNTPDLTFGPRSFLGWFDSREGGIKYTAGSDFSKPPFDNDITLYAHWDDKEVTITFKDDVTNTNLTQQTVDGRLTSFPQLPNVSGKVFLGWFVGSATTPVTLDEVYTSDTTLTGKWEERGTTAPDTPVVTFIIDIPPMPTDDAGQSEVAHFTMVTDGSASSGRLKHLPELVGADKFNGWHEKGDNDPVKPSTVYTGDTNLYVSLSQTFQITLDWNNGDDGKVSDKTFLYTGPDGKIPLADWPDPDTDGKRPERPGCYFDNWYTMPSGGDVVPKGNTFTAPTVIYAHWKSPYTITFNANGGTFPDGETEIEAETDLAGSFERAKIPADPTREGYTKFGGWAISEDGTGGAVDPATYKQPYTDPMTFYAIWGPPYAIEYDVMGGDELTVTDEQKLTTDEGKYPELPTPTREKYSFGGWYTTKDYQDGTQATTGGDCPGAVTLYAKWERVPPYDVTFVANREGATMEDPDSGAAVTTITLKTDDKGVLMKAPPEPMLRGGKFQGWYTKAEEGTGDLVADAATRTYTDDTTLYAHWETMEFKITFDFNLSAIMSNPTNVTTYTTTKGGSLTYLPGDLPQASSGDKKISGWYRVPNPTAKDQPVTKSDVFYRDTTLYAQWVDADDPPIVFKYPNITFMNEDGNKAMITLEVDTDYKLATFPEPPYKEGHTFTGWVTRDPDGTEHPLTSDTLITGSLVAYPKYAQKGYTITFEPGEETELDPTKVTTTSEGRIPDGSMPDDPVWEGHTFNGWYTSATGGTKINRRTVFTQDTTVYAHWDGSDGETPSGEYTITFDADGGSVTPTSATTVNGKLQILPTPTKSGYTFDGWYNGTSAVTVDTVYTADTTLKAHWKSDGGSDGPSSAPYTITFNPNGGNLETAATALTDLQGRLMSIPTPRRTGYSFDGWYNGTERVTTATVFTKNTEVVARWTTGSGGGSGSDSGTNGDNGYTVTVNNNSGGRVSVSTTYAREGDRVTVTIRPYTGYQLDQINVTNARGYDVSLRDQGGNRYTFYMPASRVTVDATFMELIANGNGNGDNGGNNGGNTGGNTGGSTGGNGGTGGTLNPITPPVTSGNGVFSEPVLNTVPMPYVDVTPSAWYYSSVDYMWQRSLMGGVSANRFGPQATTSNAMIWTILARLAGVDVTAGGGIWYENARSWAVSNRISDGVGPNNAVTREQLATMLWNYRGSPAASYDLGRFGDRGQISTYQAENALRWAVANNIVSGSGNRLNPRGTATRAEVAAMITRFCQNT